MAGVPGAAAMHRGSIDSSLLLLPAQLCSCSGSWLPCSTLLLVPTMDLNKWQSFPFGFPFCRKWIFGSNAVWILTYAKCFEIFQWGKRQKTETLLVTNCDLTDRTLGWLLCPQFRFWAVHFTHLHCSFCYLDQGLATCGPKVLNPPCQAIILLYPACEAWLISCSSVVAAGSEACLELNCIVVACCFQNVASPWFRQPTLQSRGFCCMNVPPYPIEVRLASGSYSHISKCPKMHLLK